MAIDAEATSGLLPAASGAAQGATGQAAGGPDVVAQAHQALMGQRDLQFDFRTFVAPQPPTWIKPLFELIQALAPVFKVIFWAGAALALGVIGFFIVSELMGVRWPWGRGRRKPAAAQPEWRPSAERARILLEDADRLASQGRFDEAVHLLLFRSIEDIDGRWPGLVRPALTSRDIGRLGPLPETARRTFSAIAQVVERSLFGGQAVGAADFSDCRQAYQAFALPVGA